MRIGRHDAIIVVSHNFANMPEDHMLDTTLKLSTFLAVRHVVYVNQELH